MSTAERIYTAGDILELESRGESYELVGGRLLETGMSQESNWVGFRIAHLIQVLLDRERLGWIFTADHPFDLFGDGSSIRKPDVAFLSNARLPEGPGDTGITTAVPDLAVEVVSPNDRVSDLKVKLEEYFSAGISLVWVVHPEVRQILVHIGGNRTPVVLTETDTLTGGDVLPGFAVPVADIFPPRSVGGDAA
ncbi:MAG: Uma2 family endonuclease [Planctomycetota bacterium]